MTKLEIEGIITEVKDPRTVNLRDGGQARVAEMTLEDAHGKIPLSLWDDQIDLVAKGSRVKITNGYTRAFMGTVQLNVGKWGKLEVLSGKK